MRAEALLGTKADTHQGRGLEAVLEHAREACDPLTTAKLPTSLSKGTNRQEATVGGISSNQLYVALIAAAFAAGLTAATTLVFFAVESRRTRRDRREEYFLDSASDLADRIWDTLIALRAHDEPPMHWSEVRRTALVLRAGLLGQTPRYRLARVHAASEAVTFWLGSFIGFWATTVGRDTANRDLLGAIAKHHRELVDQASIDPTEVVSLAPDVFTVGDLDAALLEIYRESLDKLEELVLGVLNVLSVYTPGEVALQVSPPTGSWPDYPAALKTATARRRSRDSTDSVGA